METAQLFYPSRQLVPKQEKEREKKRSGESKVSASDTVKIF